MALTALVGTTASGAGLPDDVLLYQWDSDPVDPSVEVVAFLLETDDGHLQSTNSRRIDVAETLRRGGTVVVALTMSASSDLSKPFCSWLLTRYGSEFQPQHIGNTWEMKGYIHSLDKWYRRHLAHAVFATKEVDLLASAIDLNGEPAGAASFSVPIDSGRLVITQLRDGRAASQELVAFIGGLPPTADYPAYLDELAVDEAGDLAEQLQAARAEVSRLDGEIGERRELKRIMYVEGVELELAVVDFFTHQLGIPAEHVPGNREDFWLVRGEPAERWCIGEVKGKERGNVSRGDVSATDAHRDEAELPPEHPALLVVNSFAKASSIAERDESIHPDQVKRARADNIVVARTLDLVRLRRLILRETSARDRFVEAVAGPSGGWYEVSADLVATLR